MKTDDEILKQRKMRKHLFRKHLLVFYSGGRYGKFISFQNKTQPMAWCQHEEGFVILLDVKEEEKMDTSTKNG